MSDIDLIRRNTLRYTTEISFLDELFAGTLPADSRLIDDQARALKLQQIIAAPSTLLETLQHLLNTALLNNQQDRAMKLLGYIDQIQNVFARLNAFSSTSNLTTSLFPNCNDLPNTPVSFDLLAFYRPQPRADVLFQPYTSLQVDSSNSSMHLSSSVSSAPISLMDPFTLMTSTSQHIVVNDDRLELSSSLNLLSFSPEIKQQPTVDLITLVESGSSPLRKSLVPSS